MLGSRPAPDPQAAAMQMVHDTRHALATIDAAGIGTLCLRDAGALNIVGRAAIGELTDALRTLGAEPRLRVLVLRGAGERAFIGGADIAEMAALTPDTAQGFIGALAGLCDAVRALPVPVVARLAGWCLGGGLEVAAACDLRLADATARFGMPEVKVGIPSVIHAALLPQLVGQARAEWLLLTGETIDAARAEAWGLVHEGCPAGALDALVGARAAALAALPPQALRQQKRLLQHWQTVPPAQAVQDSVADFAAAFATGEPQQQMGAFLARKRTPRA
jgi:enoyl-CoA hydratase/carnithine racemase